MREKYSPICKDSYIHKYSIGIKIFNKDQETRGEKKEVDSTVYWDSKWAELRAELRAEGPSSLGRLDWGAVGENRAPA